MKKTQISSFSYIIYEKLKRELADYDDEIGPSRAKKIIVNALSLLPHITVENTNRTDIIIIRSTAHPRASVEMHLQNAIDSLLILWNERIRLKDAS